MDTSKWPQKQEPDFCFNRIFKLMPRLSKCTNVLGHHVDKLYFSEQMSYI